MKFNSYNLKQRFGIRKYHVGVCSVLLGMTLMGIGSTVSADEVTATSSADKTEVVSSNSVVDSVDSVSESTATATADATSSSDTATSGSSTSATAGTTTSDSSSGVDKSSSSDSSLGTSADASTVPTSLSAVDSSEPSTGTEDISTKNLGFTVVQKSETDNKIESGSVITNVLTLTTTDNVTLSKDSYLKQIIRIDSNHKLPVAKDDTYLTDNVTRVGSSTDENDSEIVSISKLPLGEVSTGTIRSYISNARLFNLSNGQNLSITYELVDNAKVLARKSLKYAVQEVKPVYDTSKTISEYLTTYNKQLELTKSLPLEVTTTIKNGLATSYQWGTVEYTVPDGFKISDDDKSRGITQDGNKVTVKFTVGGLVDATKLPSEYANAVSWGDTVHFDTSSFGTYNELKAGKDYTITRKVTMYNETGNSDTQTSTITGTLRTPDVGDGIGEGEGSATTNNEKLFKDNVLAPSKQLIRLYVGESEKSFTGGKFIPYGDGIIYNFDKLDTLKDYTLTLNSVYPIMPTNVSDIEKNATFDVYSVDTGAKLGSIAMKSRIGSGIDGGYENTSTVTIPNNTKSIKFVPTGSINAFGASTYRGLGTSWILTPTDKSGLIERFDAKGALSSSASVNLVTGSPIATDVTFTKDESTVKTYVQWSSTTTGSASPTGDKAIGDQQWEVDIINKDNKVSTDGISSVTADKANLILNIPEELSVTIKGKTYGKGLHSISMNDVEYRNYGTKVFVVKVNASKNAPDGEFELQWAIDWSNASDETKLALKGESPMSGILESTKNSQKFTIINLLQLGSQTSIENKDGSTYTSTKDDVETNKSFHIKQTVYNTLKNAVKDVQAITYLPRKGFEGSTYSVTLNEAITAPANWAVQYSTDTPTGDRDADMSNLKWSSSVSDYSKVTAIKYVQTAGTFDTNARVPFTMSVKTTDKLGLSDVAKLDVAIKSPSIAITVRSKSAEMTPLSYTERWQDTKGVDLKEPVKTLSEPSLTTTDTFTNYDHVDDNRLARITTHVYKLQDKADVTVVHKLADGTVISTKKVVNQGKIGLAYRTTAEVPATKTVVTESGSDLVTTVTTYTTAIPSNAVGKVTLGGTTVTYVYTPKETSTKTPKEKKLSEAKIASTMTYVPDSSLEYNTAVVDVPNKDGKTVTVAVSKIVDGKIVTTNETRTEVEKVDGKTRVGNVKTETTPIAKSTVYKATNKAVGTNETLTKGSDGVSTTVTTYTVNSSTGALENGNPVTTTTTEKVDTVEGIGNVKTETTPIAKSTVYKATNKAVGTNETITKGSDGVSTTVTTYEVNATTGALENGKPVTTTTTEKVDTVEGIGNVKTEVKDIDFATKYQPSGELVGSPNKTVTEGVKGTTTIVTTYEVNSTTGVLENGKPVTTTVDAKDKVVSVANVKVTSKDIDFETVYEYDSTLEPNAVKETQAGVKGVSTTTDSYNVDSATGKLTTIADTKTDVKDPVKRIVKYNNIVVTTEKIPNGTKYVPSGSTGTDKTTVTEGVSGTRTITVTNPKPNDPTGTEPTTVTDVVSPIDEVVSVPSVVIVTEEVPNSTSYVASGGEIGTGNVVKTEGHVGSKQVTTSYDVDSSTGELKNPTTTDKLIASSVDRVVEVPNVKTTNEDIAFNVVYKYNKDLPSGTTKTVQDGVVGTKTVVTTYEVDSKTGDLKNPTSSESIKASVDKVIEFNNISVTEEGIPHGTKYVPSTDGSSTTTEGKDGVKKITIENPAPDAPNGTIPKTTEEVVTPPTDTIISVSNVKVVEEKEDFSTIYKENPDLTAGETNVITEGVTGVSRVTTTYEVDPSTGALLNPVTATEVISKRVDKVIEVGTKPTVTTEITKHSKEFRDNPNLPEGVTRVVKEGTDGKIITTTTYTFDSKTGTVTPNTPTTETINPSDEIIEVGTKRAVVSSDDVPTPEVPKAGAPKSESPKVETTSATHVTEVVEGRTLSRVADRHELPNTGESSAKAVGILGLVSLGLGLVGFKKRKEEE